MVHTKTRLSAEQANMGETKAWQPTDKLTKDINTTAIQDEMMMIHADNLKKGFFRCSFRLHPPGYYRNG
jgi:hypothetical protein